MMILDWRGREENKNGHSHALHTHTKPLHFKAFTRGPNNILSNMLGFLKDIKELYHTLCQKWNEEFCPECRNIKQQAMSGSIKMN